MEVIDSGLKRRMEFTDFKVIIFTRNVHGVDGVLKYDACSSRAEAVERLKGRFDQFANRIDIPAETKLLDIDNLCGSIKYKDGSEIYIDVEVNASLIPDKDPNQQVSENKIYGIMSIFAMTKDVQIRNAIAKHVTELANGQQCTIKLAYKEVDKRDEDGRYAGKDLYFIDDISIPDWLYYDLRSVFKEEN